MAAERTENDASIIKDLAEAVSTQARVANRAWLVLMAIAVVVLVPRSTNGKADGSVAMPLGIGDIDPEWFFPVAFLVLAVLTIGFCAAHAQQVRAAKLAQRAVDALGDETVGSAKLHPRDLFDMLRLPSISRIAPLAQLLRGKHQFHPQAAKCPRYLTVVSAAWYLVLKVVAALVFFGLPAAALVHAYHRVHVGAPLSWLLFGVGAVAAVTLVQVLIVDVRYVWQVRKLIAGARA